MSLENRITALREKWDYSRKEAADLLEISYDTLSKYEQGKRTPDIDMLAKIASLYHVSTDLLLGNTYTFVPENLIREQGVNSYNLLQYALQEYFNRSFDYDDLDYIKLALDMKAQEISLTTFGELIRIIKDGGKS